MVLFKLCDTIYSSLPQEPFGMSNGDFYYFGVRGRGFVARLLLELAHVEHNYHCISFEQWPSMKETCTFGQLPIWKDSEIGTLAQSDAIQRYLANKYNLNGKNAVETARIDEIYEECNDLFNGIIRTVFSGDQFEEKKKDLLEKEIPKHVGFLTNLLKKNNGGNGWFVGDSLSLADVQAFHALNNSARPWGAELLSDELKGFLKRFREHPDVAKFLKEKMHKTTVANVHGVKFLHLEEHFAGEFE